MSASSTELLLDWLAAGEHVVTAPAVQFADRVFAPGFLDDLKRMSPPSDFRNPPSTLES